MPNVTERMEALLEAMKKPWPKRWEYFPGDLVRVRKTGEEFEVTNTHGSAIRQNVFGKLRRSSFEQDELELVRSADGEYGDHHHPNDD